MLLAGGVSLAAGFDCRKARYEDEKAICANPELSRLDDELAAAYGAALKRMSGDTRRIAMFRKDQAAWTRERARCGGTASCLKNETLRRTRWLGNPAHRYAGDWVAKNARLTFHVKDDGLIYIALWPDKRKPAEHQDRVFSNIDAKFSPAAQNRTGEDQIIIANPQFSRLNAALKGQCGEIRLSFGTAEMMGLETSRKCPLLAGPGESDFAPAAPLFVYDSMR